jgi:hypothetical protein
MDCVCVPFRWWLSKTKYLSAFERGMVVGNMRTSLCQELQYSCIFHAQQFPVCIEHGPQPKWLPTNLTQLWEVLESTWASIPVKHIRHLVESIARQIEAVLRAKKVGVQLDIRKVFLMFGLLSVNSPYLTWYPNPTPIWPPTPSRLNQENQLTDLARMSASDIRSSRVVVVCTL